MRLLGARGPQLPRKLERNGFFQDLKNRANFSYSLLKKSRNRNLGANQAKKTKTPWPWVPFQHYGQPNQEHTLVESGTDRGRDCTKLWGLGNQKPAPARGRIIRSNKSGKRIRTALVPSSTTRETGYAHELATGCWTLRFHHCNERTQSRYDQTKQKYVRNNKTTPTLGDASTAAAYPGLECDYCHQFRLDCWRPATTRADTETSKHKHP